MTLTATVTATPRPSACGHRIVDAFGLVRTEPVLVMGGGLTTDVAGFACAIHRKGTPYIRVPTTPYAHSTRPQHTLRHSWQPGDLVVRDNRCVLHRADHDGVTR